MAIATVKSKTSYKGADGYNAGQLYPGDVLLGSKTNVFNFYEIRRAANGNVIKFNGTCALSALEVKEDTSLPPLPPVSTKTPFSLKVTGFKQFNGELEKE